MSPTDPPPDSDDAAGSSDAFFEQVYDELRAIAHARMRGERPGQTIQSTELVHEAYLRLYPGEAVAWRNRAHFFAAAAQAMRRILIQRARAKGRVKRGGDSAGRPAEKIWLGPEEVAALADDRDPHAVLAIDHAIERLAEQDTRAAKIVRLRFYAGLSVAEVAETLDVSERTVLRDWEFARAWLHRRLAEGAADVDSADGARDAAKADDAAGADGADDAAGGTPGPPSEPSDRG